MSVKEKMTAIADAIRGKTGGTSALTLDQMAEQISGIETGSENALDYTNDISGLFQSMWLGKQPEFTVSFGKETSALPVISNVFYSATGVNSININYEGSCTSGDISLYFTFRNSPAKTIDISSLSRFGITSLDRTFRACTALKEIIGTMDLTPCTNTAGFVDATALETVRFAAGSIYIGISFASCPNLTVASIQNIIDGLAEVTDGTAPLLTLHADVGAKLTDAQKAVASAKNWTLVY